MNATKTSTGKIQTALNEIGEIVGVHKDTGEILFKGTPDKYGDIVVNGVRVCQYDAARYAGEALAS